jgi:hypothetical protein
MACIDVALGAVESADLVVTDAGTTETALGTVLSSADIRKSDTNDAALGGISTTVNVQVAETAGDCLGATIPLDCTGATWAACYQVTSATLTALRACAAASDADDDGVNPEWDGTFVEDGNGCQDLGGGAYQQYWYGHDIGAVCIGGKAVSNIEVFYYSDGVTPWFEVNIVLTGGVTGMICDLYKYDGGDPTGVYPGDAYCCDDDIEIEECPA